MTELNTSDKTVAKTWGWQAPPDADPLTHWVNGDAVHGGSFAMPIITHVSGNLYHGGFVEGIDLKDTFDSIISLYQWERYPSEGVTYTYEMYDGGQVDIATIESAAAQVAASLEAGHRTLVHCQAGLNRSGVVVARVLMGQGMSAAQAIRYLRGIRSQSVLCNPYFGKWLLSLDGSK